MLEDIPSIDEVKNVVFSMDGKSAARPDGYTGKLFTFAWDIIAQDVYQAVVSSFAMLYYQGVSLQHLLF